MLAASTQADEHLDDAGGFVLRVRGVGRAETADQAEDVDGGGALHGGALGHREEVEAVSACASGVAFGEGEGESRRRRVRVDRGERGVRSS